jgi:nitric oxide reductase NorE protein
MTLVREPTVDPLVEPPADAGLNSGAPVPRPERERRIPGEAGLWALIFADLCVFSVLFGVFLHYRGLQPELFNHSQAELHRYFGAINTLLLLSSSLCVVLGVEAIRRRQGKLARLAIGAALACGSVFLINKGIEWGTLLSEGHKPASNDFFMYFFVLTGIHAMHVVLGMAALAVLFALSRKQELSKYQYVFVESGACFWHLVDLLWIVLFALLYLMH